MAWVPIASCVPTSSDHEAMHLLRLIAAWT